MDYTTNNTSEAGLRLNAMGPTAKRVYNYVKTQNNAEGLTAMDIATGLSLDLPACSRAGRELVDHGLFYTTVDDETWAVMDEEI